MPKYKNTKPFMQPLTIDGKRVIVRPGEVISSQKELNLDFCPFLQKVDESTPAQKPLQVKQGTNPNLAPEIEKIKKTIETVKQEVVTVEEHNKHVDDVSLDIKELKDGQDLILKRLEIMKAAVDTVSQALKHLEEIVCNNENFVIEDTDEHK